MMYLLLTVFSLFVSSSFRRSLSLCSLSLSHRWTGAHHVTCDALSHGSRATVGQSGLNTQELQRNLTLRCWAHGRTLIYPTNIYSWTLALSTVSVLMQPLQCNQMGVTTHRDQLCLNTSLFLDIVSVVNRLNRDCARHHSPQWSEQHVICTINTPSAVSNMP